MSIDKGKVSPESLVKDEVEQIEDIEPVKLRNDQSELSSIESTAASKAAWLISIVVSIGGLLFGYDTGYISAVLVTIDTSLGHVLSSKEQEMVTSLTSGGALVGAIGAGLTADRFGRRWPIWGACLLFVTGTVIQTCAYSVAQFATGRFVVGLGVGGAAMVVPLYIGELAPAKHRGRMVAFNNMSVTFGQFLASALGAGFANVKGEGWRATVGIGAAPAIVLAGLLFFCPESPRQLVSHGQHSAAKAVLQRIYPKSTEEQRQAKILSIELSLNEATHAMAEDSLWISFKRIFTTPATGRAVLTACVTMAISQLGGFNTLMYYAATLFSIVGFDNPTAVGITVSGTNFVFSIVNLVLVDRLGRRIILSVTVLGMAICMMVAVIAFRYIPVNTDTLELETAHVGWPGTLVLVAIICYVACYSSGVATIAWIGTELIPLEVRAIGTMLNTVTCWSTNIIIASTFLSMMKSWTPSGAFGFYTGICFIGWLFVIFFYPECKGMPLEAVREVFGSGFGVRYSKKWQKEHKNDDKTTMVTFGH
ncbi:Major facilitator superfamily domain general substrate transporter [Penicillium macrosclerotiorum]|uniref:Major facilitator superfamily domain general substrate transporter n=1 Tax=Penicillium macrosclerotiorum TaxID=303699 RepID=UPI002548AFCC|nr:Major facilitator superfamily domain general substrate transporter [Penicillium macrosclerotiorum]KAJ5676218.1 Major facilitator superfamily domain general substrate transporter [Penicillium macrosclerotiorum]